MKLWGVLPLAALLVYAFVKPETVKVRASGSREMSEESVLARVADVAKVVAPRAGTLNLSVADHRTEMENAGHTLWIVEAADANRVLRMRAQVDGITGEVVQVTLCEPTPERGYSRSLTKADAERTAARWLETLQPFERARTLKATNAWPANRGWMVRFDGGGRRAFAIVDGRTGGLHAMTVSYPGMLRQASSGGPNRS